jgi:hypothetical protein
MRILKYYEFALLEKLGINQDVELLSNYLKSKIESKSMIIDNIPLKLSKPISKIYIKIERSKSRIAAFNLSKSKLTDDGYELHFIFQTNPTIDVISHEVNHALQFIMKGHEKSIKAIDDIKAARYSLGFVPFGEKNKKLNEVVDLIYYLNDTEINSLVVETHARIKELYDKIDKELFIHLIKRSDAYKICEFVEYLNLEDYLKDISTEDKIKFFSILKDKKIELNQNVNKSIIKKIITSFKNIFYKGNMELIELNATIDRYDNHFKIQSDKLKRKLFRLYDNLND